LSQPQLAALLINARFLGALIFPAA